MNEASSRASIPVYGFVLACAVSCTRGEQPAVNMGLQSVHLVGRFDTSDRNAPRAAWSGSGVVASFEGSEVSVSLTDGGSQFTVIVDGEKLPTLITQPGQQTYQLISDLGAGRHWVEVYRRNEASFGPTTFHGFDFGEEARGLAPPRVTRRIELIGDSISTAYGNEGTDPSCGFSADTQNHYLSYGAIAARELGAELVTVAWSGKGVVYNYDTDREDPMPALYDRAIPTEPNSLWDYSKWVADAVVINLGTNDFSTADDPPRELFAAEYLGLLARVRSHYPEALILCTVGPLLNESDLALARAGIEEAVATFLADGGDNVRIWEMEIANSNPGCDYHPSLRTHALMADELASRLRSALDW